MPKPSLHASQKELEGMLIETMLAGHKQYRPDLPYPQSHSDMAACARAVIKMFDISRLPLPRSLKIQCDDCEGIGKFVSKDGGSFKSTTCSKCNGKGYTERD